MKMVKGFKNRLFKAFLALTMSIGTNALVFTSVSAEGGEYKQLDDTSTIDYNFEFENAINTDSTDAAVFVTLSTDTEGNVTEKIGNTANGNTTQTVTTNSPVTIKFPSGFKYYNEAVYDLYITITPEDDYYEDSSNVNWTATKGTKVLNNKTYKYITVQPGTVNNHNFNYSMVLRDPTTHKQVNTINFVADSCYTHASEGARPWGNTNIVYYNGAQGTLTYVAATTSTDAYFHPNNGDTDNTPEIYILGHGTDNGVVNGGYVRTNGGAAEMVYGYIVNTNSFVVGDTTTEQVTPEGSTLVVPNDVSANVPTGSYISGWTADKDVKVGDTTITAGNTITPDQLTTIVPTEDVTYTATITQYTSSVTKSSESTTNVDKYVLKKDDTDTTGVASATISATSQTYNGSEWNGHPQINLDSLKTYLPSVNYSNVTCYVKGETDTAPDEANKTTSTNSGAATDGGAPTNVGTYFVKATINSGVDGIDAKDIYTTYQITPVASSTTVESVGGIKGVDYTGQPIALVTETNTTGGKVWYRVGTNGTWQDTIPTGTNAGAYNIYYYVKGDANHTDSGSQDKPSKVTTIINKVRATTSTASGTTNVYDGTAKELVKDVVVHNGTMKYKLGDDGTWQNEIPTATDVGKYKIYYYVEGDANHFGDPTMETPNHVDSEITPLESSTTLTGNDRTYDGSTKPLVTNKKTTGGTTYYSLDGKTFTTSIPEVKDAGKYTVYYYVKGDENYSDYGSETEPKTIEVEVKKAASSTEVKPISFKYDGTSKKVVTAFNTVGGTVYYSLDGKTYSEGIPQLKDAGKYTVYYYVKGDANHSDYGSADKPYKVEVEITKEEKSANTSDTSNTLFYGLAGVTSVMVAGVLLVLRRKMSR